MSQLQEYEPNLLGSPVVDGGTQPETSSPISLVVLWTVFRRYWLMVVLLWIVFSVPSIMAVLELVKPMYVASATIEVAPVIPRVLYEDEKTRTPMPMFDYYLNTLARAMVSWEVLNIALRDPLVADSPILDESDPVAALRECIAAASVRRTQLVALEVKRGMPQDALNLAKAIFGAFIARVYGSEAEDGRAKRETLERSRGELAAQLGQQAREIAQLGERFGAASPSMFETLRENHEEGVMQMKLDLVQAEAEVARIEHRIQQVELGAYPESFLDSAHILRELSIEDDTVVSSLREERDGLSVRLANLAAVLDDGAEEPNWAKSGREVIAQLDAALKVERERARQEVDERRASAMGQRVDEEEKLLAALLTAAKDGRDRLNRRVEAEEEKGREIGQRGLAIERRQKDEARTQSEYDRVVGRIRELEVESSRPTRISVSSAPAMSPEKFDDDRLKFSVLAVAMSFFAAFSLGFLRHLLDPRLRDTKQAEVGAGLQLLGVVPSLADLHSGRIDNAEFVESYRVIRATLSAGAGEHAVPKSMLITSAQAAEGKTSLAVSLACSLAEAGSRVLLLDGDLQGPSIARLLKLNGGHDLKAVLRGEFTLKESVVKSSMPGVDAILSNSSHRADDNNVVTTQAVARCLSEAIKHYDHVVVDSPPALGSADALVWAQVVDCVIMSVMVGHSNTKAIRLTAKRILGVGSDVAGMVIANVSVAETYYSYSRSSYSRAPASDGGVQPHDAPLVPYLPEPNKCQTET